MRLIKYVSQTLYFSVTMWFPPQPGSRSRAFRRLRAGDQTIADMCYGLLSVDPVSTVVAVLNIKIPDHEKGGPREGGGVGTTTTRLVEIWHHHIG